MKFQARPATVGDARLISALGKTTFEQTFGYLFQHYPGDLAHYLATTFDTEKIRRSLAREQNAYWLALLDGAAVGYAKLKAPSESPLCPASDAAQLQKIYVLRPHLSQGIGALLLNAAVQNARARDIRTLWLAVLSENSQAISFYRRHEFEAIGKTTFAIGAQTFNFDILETALR